MTQEREVPPGYDLVERDIGAGKTSRVSLVRRTSDGAQFAWKVPSGGKADSHEVLASLVARSREWVRLGAASAEIAFAPDGETLLQPWVEGISLRRLFLETDLLTEAANPHLAPLADTFLRIVGAKAYISGLNSENLIFDGMRFRVVDSGAVRKMSSTYGAWRRQREKLAGHWVRFDGHSKETIEALLLRMEETMGLPSPGWKDRLSYLLFRR